MEKWDVLNADGTFTGRTTVRGRSKLNSDEYHLVVHIWVVSSNGEFLIQRRSENKKLMPGEWAATGGAAVSGETSFEAASRELYEELGIVSTQDTLKKLTRLKRRNSLLDIWFIKSDVVLGDLKLQKSEVADAKWVTRDGLLTMINNGYFHNYGKEYFDTLFSKIDCMRGAVL